MEDLNNSQLILLAILVSFVTSIATGILTVSLMTGDSRSVTQTINQVVERTIEKVVPGETKTVIKEVPVIITEEDLIRKVITAASSSLARLEAPGVGGILSRSIGLGFFVSSDQVASLPSDDLGNVKEVKIKRGDRTLSGVLAYTDLETGIVIFKVTGDISTSSGKILGISNPLTGGKPKDTATPLPLAGVLPDVGQTAIGLGLLGGDNQVVSVGIVSSFGTMGTSSVTTIHTNAATGENIGGPLLNIRGEVVGINWIAGEALNLGQLKSAIDAASK